jgi:hypothetical protein
VSYQNFNDGMKAMETMELKLTNPEKAAAEAKARAEQERLVATTPLSRRQSTPSTTTKPAVSTPLYWAAVLRAVAMTLPATQPKPLPLKGTQVIVLFQVATTRYLPYQRE